MRDRSSTPKSLDRFFHEVGVPCEMLTDNAPELVQGEWSKMCSRHYVKQKFTEPYSPWQNQSELERGIIKRKLRRLMKATATPIGLWDYAWKFVSEIRYLTATNHMYLDRRTPYEKVCGYTPNITEYILFHWYDWVWYYTVHDISKLELGRWLGPAINICQGLAFYVLTSEAKVIVRSTVSSLSQLEKKNEPIIKLMKDFDSNIDVLIGNFSQNTIDNINGHMVGDDIYNNIFEHTYSDTPADDKLYGNYDSNGNYVLSEKDNFEIDDIYSVEASSKASSFSLEGKTVTVPHEGEMKTRMVKERKRDHNGLLVGRSNKNPRDNRQMYEVSFHDSSYAEYSANILLENMQDILFNQQSFQHSNF